MGSLGVTLFALFCVGTIAYLVAMSIARTLYSMARDGLMPGVLATVWKNGTPAVAVLKVVCGLAGAFALTGTYDRLLAIYAPFSIGVNMALNVAAIALRLREPKLERPYRMPLFPLPAVVAFLLNGALMVGVVLEDPANSLWSVVATLLSVPIYFV
ncbi:MAG: amino acid permease [Alphaproteobacteria bacterium]